MYKRSFRSMYLKFVWWVCIQMYQVRANFLKVVVPISPPPTMSGELPCFSSLLILYASVLDTVVTWPCGCAQSRACKSHHSTDYCWPVVLAFAGGTGGFCNGRAWQDSTSWRRKQTVSHSLLKGSYHRSSEALGSVCREQDCWVMYMSEIQ